MVPFPDWTPSDWGDPAYECKDVNYRVTAYTLLDDDNNGNDIKSKDITLRLDSIPPVIIKFKSKPWQIFGICLGIVNRGRAKDDCSGLDRVEWFKNGAPWPPATTFLPWGRFLRIQWGGPCSNIITIRVYDKAGNWA